MSATLPVVDYHALFDAIQGHYLVLLPDAPTFTIAAVSTAYLGATMTQREAILGRSLFEVFPDNPDDPKATGVANLRASLEFVLHSRAPHKMAIQKYDVRRPESEGGGFEERYWSPVNSPVLDDSGEVMLLVHRVEDVTEFVKLQVQGREELRQAQEYQSQSEQHAAANLLRAEGLQETNSQLHAVISERKQAEEALRESEDQFRATFEQAAVGIAHVSLEGGRLLRINQKFCDILEYSHEELRECTFKDITHPDDVPADFPFLLQMLAGEIFTYSLEKRYFRKDGSVVWGNLTVSLARQPSGEPNYFISVIEDITERKQAQLEIESLNARLQRSMTETHHRVKNNLQVISALAEVQMEEHSETVPVSALARIGQHTRSLAAIHDLLTQESKTKVGVDTISTRAALNTLIALLQATAGERRLRAEIAEFALSIQESTSLVMLVSELVSNALKHGSGEIGITLRRQEDQAELEVCDDGHGFPPDFNPRTSGNTGLGLIDSTGRYDLRGTIFYENRAEGGARIRVVFPISD